MLSKETCHQVLLTSTLEFVECESLQITNHVAGKCHAIYVAPNVSSFSSAKRGHMTHFGASLSPSKMVIGLIDWGGG